MGGTNYVIAAWSGARRDGGNGLECLKKQIHQLNTLRHNVAQITVVVPENQREPDNFRRYLESLQSGPTQTVVLRRPNVGLSYGSWSFAYDTYEQSFDHYIFMEDDYYFVESNFDTTLTWLLEDAGYLCGYVSEREGVRWPGNAIGIAGSAALEKVKKRFGRLPYDSEAKDGRYTLESGQIEWGKAFAACGLRLASMTQAYGCLHWYWQHKECRLIPDQPKSNDRFLYVPYQAQLNHGFLLFKDRYAGKEGILYATGPTLNQYDYLEDDGTRIRVGVNSFILEEKANDLDYYFCGHLDKRSEKYIRLASNLPRVAFGYVQVNGASSDQWLTESQARKLDMVPYEISTGLKFEADIARHPLVDHAINFSALQFMVYAGIKKIYLVGCDTTLVTSHRDDSPDNTRLVGRLIEVWGAFKLFAEEQGVEIISINPVTLKGLFKERVTEPSNA